MDFSKKFLSILLIFCFTILPCGCSENPSKKTLSKQITIKKEETQMKVNFTETSSQINIPYQKIILESKLKPYKVKSNLNNIEYLGYFDNLTYPQKEALINNSFYINPQKIEHLNDVYKSNEYKKIPTFVSTDSVLHAYNAFCDSSFQKLKRNELIPLTKELTKSLLNKSIILYEEIKTPEVKNAQLKNIAFLSVGSLLLGENLPTNIPQKAKKMAISEFKKISTAQTKTSSSIFPFEIDYRIFKIDNDLIKTDKLVRFQKTIDWFQKAPFPLYIEKDKEMIKDIEQTLQGLLLTYCLLWEKDNSNDWKKYDTLYNCLNFYLGSVHGLSSYDYKNLLLNVYGKNINLDNLSDTTKIDLLYQEFGKTKIISNKYFFLGKRYQTALDSNEIKTKLKNIKEKTSPANLSTRWLWVLKDLAYPINKGYPSFMNCTEYEKKSLNTILCSLKEVENDTFKTKKEIKSVGYLGIEPTQIKGYVEPNIEVYNKLLWLTKYSEENLKRNSLLTKEISDKLIQFKNLLNFLITCSKKELNNIELSDDEYFQLSTYGDLLESLNMDCIETGFSPASEILVVVPIKDKLYLTKGAVFSKFCPN